MAQRQLFRGACRALSECQSSLRSAAGSGSKNGNVGFSLKSVVGKMQGSSVPAAGLASCPVLRSLGGSVQVSAFQAPAPMGFAASALSVTSPLSVLGSGAQHRGLATADGSEDGEGEDSDPTYLRPVADPQNSLLKRAADDSDDPPDLRGGRESADPGPFRRQAGGPPGAKRPDDGTSDAALMEMIMTSREAFTRQPEPPRGTLPALPREVREAMFSHRWDRVLVDVRRTVVRKTRGKQDVYTAMVATGNMAGVLGLGMGVADNAQLAVARAHLDSFRQLTAVPLYRGHTIYHQVDYTHHRTQMRLMPRPEGWGVRACDLLYELCSVVGIRNISIKMPHRTKNKFFIAKCFQEALQEQTNPHDGVEATGMYIREMYHGELPYGLKRGVDVL